jgi:hypothetical protein
MVFSMATENSIGKMVVYTEVIMSEELDKVMVNITMVRARASVEVFGGEVY